MTDTTPKRVILVTGATGKQGGATIDALITSGALDTHKLVAVTRNTESASAKRLAGRGVQLVQGDLNDIPAIFTAVKKELGDGGDHAKIWGVFSVQQAVGGGASPESEERQGKALVDAALAHGVEHFVYTSVDRGGDARSFSNPTEVPHFASKHNIEHHLVDKVAAAAAAASASSGGSTASRMTWTILRPVAFMDNFTPGFGTKIVAAAYRTALREGQPFQLVSARDIGWFAAQALLRPEAYAGRGVALAGDELTLSDLRAVFRQKTGGDMPETFQFVARILFWLSAELGTMFRWFYDEGYGADVAALRKEHPGLQSWGDWLERESEWIAKSK